MTIVGGVQHSTSIFFLSNPLPLHCGLLQPPVAPSGKEDMPTTKPSSLSHEVQASQGTVIWKVKILVANVLQPC